MKGAVNAVAAAAWVLLVIVAPQEVAARSGGITTVNGPMAGGPATCGTGSTCHGPAANNLVEVTIFGPLQMTAGGTDLFTVMMSEIGPNGLLVGVGMNVHVALDGVKDAISSSLESEPSFPIDKLQVLFGELTHAAGVNSNGQPSSGVGIFEHTFPLTAPDMTGTMTVSAAMNSFNQNFSNSFDHWARASLDVTVVPEPAQTVQTAIVTLFITALAARRRISLKGSNSLAA